MTTPQTVYVVRAECGDYYCGCGGGHILGITYDADAAKRIEDEARSLKKGRLWCWPCTSIDEHPMDTLLSRKDGAA